MGALNLINNKKDLFNLLLPKGKAFLDELFYLKKAELMNDANKGKLSTEQTFTYLDEIVNQYVIKGFGFARHCHERHWDSDANPWRANDDPYRRMKENNDKNFDKFSKKGQ